MKRKNSLCLILLIAISAVFLGCACTPRVVQPPRRQADFVNEPYRPLTPAILRRMRETDRDFSNINEHQFRLFGRIVLERVHAARPQPRVDADGILRFQDVFTREVISIHDGTPGIAVRIEDLGRNSFIVSVSFDRYSANDPDKLYLEFMATEDEDFLSLVYKPLIDLNPRPLQMGVVPMATMIDERGFLDYGDYEYQLRYSGNRKPYIMIRLAQDDQTIVDAYVAPGRRVGE